MRVIAKAYGDRPLDREMTGAKGAVAFIANMSARNSNRIEPMDGVGFPKSCVFRFDAALFDSLAAAWAGGDRVALGELWGHASPLNFEGEEVRHDQ
jgi:hypothetical protein